jgi:hypothetical protein
MPVSKYLATGWLAVLPLTACTPMLTKPYLQRSFNFPNTKHATSTAWDAEKMHVK